MIKTDSTLQAVRLFYQRESSFPIDKGCAQLFSHAAALVLFLFDMSYVSDYL